MTVLRRWNNKGLSDWSQGGDTHLSGHREHVEHVSHFAFSKEACVIGWRILCFTIKRIIGWQVSRQEGSMKFKINYVRGKDKIPISTSVI